VIRAALMILTDNSATIDPTLPTPTLAAQSARRAMAETSTLS
jgi:hypothetical protein